MSGDPTPPARAPTRARRHARRPAEDPELGSVGAGTGAAVGKIRGREFAVKSGVGLAKQHLPQGAKLAALAVVNAFGDVIGEDGQVLAGTRGDDGSFIGTTQHAAHAADRAAHLPARRAGREHDARVPDDGRRPDQDRLRDRRQDGSRRDGARGRPGSLVRRRRRRVRARDRHGAARVEPLIVGVVGRGADGRGDPRRVPSGDDASRGSRRSSDLGAMTTQNVDRWCVGRSRRWSAADVDAIVVDAHPEVVVRRTPPYALEPGTRHGTAMACKAGLHELLEVFEELRFELAAGRSTSATGCVGLGMLGPRRGKGSGYEFEPQPYAFARRRSTRRAG